MLCLGYEAVELPEAGYREVASDEAGDEGVYLPPKSTAESPR
jgi:hypothetical protein